jgi:fumarate reductase flavoprotein subunit
MKALQSDIVVIGGGGSGLIAGCRAATMGKKVIVLEKDKNLGGGMNMASTMRTFGSQWQKDRNLPDTTALYLRNRMDETYWRLDRKLAVSMIRGTGKFFDWFCTICPKEDLDQFYIGRYVFDDLSDGPLGPQSGGHHEGASGKGSGRLFVEVTSQKLQELGSEILTGVITDEILTEDGKVSGVKAHIGEEELEISCKAVILACGAWIRNPEVVEKYYPQLAAAQPYMGESPHMNRNYTGDGLELARKAGAKMDTTNMTIRMMGPMTMCRSRVMSDMSNSAFSIYVNKNGERFVCEGSQLRMGVFDSGSVQVEQPEGLCYVVFDENSLRHTIEAGDNQPQPQVQMPFGASHFPATMDEAKADIEKGLAANDGVLFTANTVEELAQKIGVPAENLKATMDAYNTAAETGMDWDCFKPADWLAPMNEAPYYAVKASLGTDGAFGGVEIDENMQAKAADGGVVPGLYVVGDLASGRFLNMAGIKKQILNDMSFAVSSGYVAGTHAAEQI